MTTVPEHLLAPAAPHARRVLHILLVEDNPLNAEYGELLLGRRGHQVRIASNGQEALALHAQHNFDLILMDLEMPVMGGLEATAAIRSRETRRQAGREAQGRPQREPQREAQQEAQREAGRVAKRERGQEPQPAPQREPQQEPQREPQTSAGPGNGGTAMPHIPIIAVTAHILEQDRQACLAAGMDGFLGKPLDIAAVDSLLATLAAQPPQ